MERPTPTDIEHEVTSIDLIVSKSDAEGVITYANPIFMKISGANKPNTLKHKDSSL